MALSLLQGVQDGSWLLTGFLSPNGCEEQKVLAVKGITWITSMVGFAPVKG